MILPKKYQIFSQRGIPDGYADEQDAALGLRLIAAAIGKPLSPWKPATDQQRDLAANTDIQETVMSGAPLFALEISGERNSMNSRLLSDGSLKKQLEAAIQEAKILNRSGGVMQGIVLPTPPTIIATEEGKQTLNSFAQTYAKENPIAAAAVVGR